MWISFGDRTEIIGGHMKYILRSYGVYFVVIWDIFWGHMGYILTSYGVYVGGLETHAHNTTQHKLGSPCAAAQDQVVLSDTGSSYSVALIVDRHDSRTTDAARRCSVVRCS